MQINTVTVGREVLKINDKPFPDHERMREPTGARETPFRLWAKCVQLPSRFMKGRRRFPSESHTAILEDYNSPH